MCPIYRGCGCLSCLRLLSMSWLGGLSKSLPHDSVSFTDNTGVFRDVKKRGKRRVLELDPAGRKIVEASHSCMTAAAWK